MTLDKILLEKYEQLIDHIKAYDKVVIAYSGGVDSTFLLKAAVEAVSVENIIAIIAESLTFPQEESIAAQNICKEWNVPFLVISTDEMTDPAFVNNSHVRCYFCKTELFTKMLQHAKAEGIAYVLEGSNADDRHDYRPGMKALQELGIKSPLLECELTKDEIRALSRHFDVPTAGKPSFACLSSRIPYGTRITEKVLKMVHDAEKIIRSFNVEQCRVRHYGDCARIEVHPHDINILAQPDIREKICKQFKEIGYTYVTLDLEGYRSGSMNLVLSNTTEEE
ncbi:ATP-dependent sacrificial sulfur transferase LarE [Candidatus Omnitrophota bacterium]